MSLVLTLLYVPADRPDRAVKALASSADVVILDLEDAVAPSAKDTARSAVEPVLAGVDGRDVQVRVNAPSTPWGVADLELLAGLPPSVSVRVPKVSSPDDVASVRSVAGDRPVHVLLETAAGVEAAYAIASAPGVASIGLGEADLASDLGLSGPGVSEGLDWCRQRLVVAARAAGLPAPAMAVWTDLADGAGLAASCVRGRGLGFVGRAAIHPRQLPVIEAAFRPSAAEIAAATEVVEAMDAATAAGSGTAVLPGGRFVDVAMVEQARRVLELAARTTPVAAPTPTAPTPTRS
ncbi:HpcH/HpaI aldolase/citrate lyase family protein [Jiangella mangrovi]|uniref:Citrate lyase subunit beta/citryl-CoA lyase n=1 Tax=Jiangella mangrovi TaxID=1524084 RepID=A0A7W9LNU0_9ACTN|nr:CoA ester lyase [Jiangella mangrovi]MBB5790631.1 citrate lyase subunit beta/citryl-CoA lyase [Jiangella mangrovi]